jgi:GNAT superfamily N-acetyltransferase/RimJ/RimL family protein N-acetyltransferase
VAAPPAGYSVARGGRAPLAECVQLERFDPLADPATAHLCHEMYLAGHPADEPGWPAMSRRSFTAWLALGWTEDHPETWLARDAAGNACGWYSIAFPERENTHVAYLAPLVSPLHRRRGIGAGLVRHAAWQAHERGRTLLAGDARQGAPGEAFCLALGAREGISEAGRVLRLDTIPAGRLAQLRAHAQAAAKGYSLMSWEGPPPERYLVQIARLYQAMNDAPRSAEDEGQHWDAARVRDDRVRVAAQGLRHYTVAVCCERTGEMAGMTQLGVDPLKPDCGFQELTVVARQHRGHRLGLLVKVAMLELLTDHEPLLARIFTGNADTNEHMIAINAELGFQVLGHRLSWELAVADMLARPVAQS